MLKSLCTFSSILTLLATFVVNSVFAADFYTQATTKFYMKPLSPNTNTVLRDHQEQKVTIAMVYQPQCKWCKKQGQWLAKAQQQCSKHFNLVLIGNNGNKQQLKRELKHFHSDIPAFQSNRKLLTSVGGIKASPTTLIFDQAGSLITKKRGYVTADALSQAAKIMSGGQCQL